MVVVPSPVRLPMVYDFRLNRSEYGKCGTVWKLGNFEPFEALDMTLLSNPLWELYPQFACPDDFDFERIAMSTASVSLPGSGETSIHWNP